MSVSEILEICQALPPDKREAVADFARFLLSREKDMVWEAELADSKVRRLDARPTGSSVEAGEPFATRRSEPAETPPDSTIPGPFGTTISNDPSRDR